MIEKRKSSVHGYGLFATQNIPAETNLGTCEGKWVKRRGIHVLEIEDDFQTALFKVTNDLKYINHGDNPNACYYDDLTVGTIREVRAYEEILHDYSGGSNRFEGYTKCKHCQRTVRVSKGRICYHVARTWSNAACTNFKKPALWISDRPIIAGGKNSDGECMRCRWDFSDGPNPDCPQCCIMLWHANK